MQTLIARLLIAGNKYAEGVEEVLEAIKRAGYDPSNPPADVVRRVPQTPHQLETTLTELRQTAEIEAASERDSKELVQAVILLCGQSPANLPFRSDVVPKRLI